MLVHPVALFVIFVVLALPAILAQQLPPILPIAVRSPYLNYWTQDPNLATSWFMFWTKRLLGWAIMVRIDGRTYQMLGRWVVEPANIIKTQITPTRTIFEYTAGPAQVTATFLSPIEISDPVKQSMPLSYVVMDISFTDNSQHEVQLYMDSTGEFVTSLDGDQITWNTKATNSSLFFEIQRNSREPFLESDDRAQDIVGILGSSKLLDDMVSSAAGTEPESWMQFNDSGVVTGASIVPPMNMGNPRLLFSIVKNLGTISNLTQPIIFAIGAYRNPAVSVITSTGETQIRAPLFATKYTTISDMMDDFFLDYDKAKKRADDVDTLISGAIGNRSDNYLNLVSLAARQTMATTELTVSKGTDGQWNMSDIKMFMKDIGDSRRVNPVEKIYVSFPFFLLINATYAGQLLSPLLESQDSPPISQAYAERDIGQTYPQADGRVIQHQEQVEHTSSMLIMSLAHVRYSGDASLVFRYSSLLRKWADYLVDSTMNPPDATTIDGGPQTNSTNLIVKGIIAIQAMAVISNITDRPDDLDKYARVASDYMNSWISRVSPLSDGQSLPALLDQHTTWAKVYNIYADVLLGTNLIPANIYETQARFYQAQSSLPSGLTENGTTDVVNIASTLFAAAAISDLSIQDDIITSLWKYVVDESQPLSMVYTPGSSSQGAPASPALGAMFAPLVLGMDKENMRASATTPPSPPTSPPSHQGAVKHAILGSVIGGVLGSIVLISLVILALWKRYRYVRQRDIIQESSCLPQPFVSIAPADREGGPFTVHPRKFRTEIERNSISQSSSTLTNQNQEQHPQPVLPNPQNYSPDNLNNRLVELSAELQALQREIRDEQGSVYVPPPSYVTRPVDSVD